MPDFLPERIRRRLYRLRDDCDPPSGEASETGIRESCGALLELERGCCQALVTTSACDTHTRKIPSESRPFNAFGQKLLEMTVATGESAVSTAAGLALSGVRTGVMVESSQLAEMSAVLRSLADRHIPLVVLAQAGLAGTPSSRVASMESLCGWGLFQIVPQSLQQALDFVLLAPSFFFCY